VVRHADQSVDSDNTGCGCRLVGEQQPSKLLPGPPQIDLQVLSKIKANGFYIASVVLSLVTTAVCITLLSQITSRALEDEITYAPLIRPAVLVAPVYAGPSNGATFFRSGTTAVCGAKSLWGVQDIGHP
jgi:hypothetical protein